MSTAPITKKLIRLIKWLSATELRYCRRYLGIHQAKNSKYLLLFNALLEQQTGSEQDLAQIIYGSTGKPSSAFSEVKRYLYQLLLSALIDYDKNSTPANQLDQQLPKSKVLFKRGLYLEGMERIKKAKIKAQTLEEWHRLMEAVKIENQFFLLDRPTMSLNTPPSITPHLSTLENFNNYYNLYLRLFISIRTNAILRTEKQKALLQRQIDHPLIKHKNWQSQRAQIFHHRILSLHAYSTSNQDTFLKNAQIDFKLSQKRYDLYKNDIRNYMSSLGNLLLSFGLQNRMEKIEQLLPNYQKITGTTKHEQEEIFVQYHLFKNNIILNKGIPFDVTSYLQEQKRKVQRISLKGPFKRSFYFQFSKIHFTLGEYSQALYYLDKCIEMLQGAIRKDLKNLYPLLRLIIHYELGNYQLLESLIRNFYRNLKEQKKLFEVEQHIIRFLDLALSAANQQELQQAFIWLKEKFQALQNKPSEAILFKYFPFTIWINSKIENRPYIELLREQSP